MIGPLLHHVDSRQTCSECRTRVYAYADELDDSGNVLRHLCARCARVARENQSAGSAGNASTRRRVGGGI